MNKMDLEDMVVAILKKAQDDLNAQHGVDAYVITHDTAKNDRGYLYRLIISGPQMGVLRLRGSGLSSIDEVYIDMLAKAIRCLAGVLAFGSVDRYNYALNSDMYHENKSL